MKSFFSLTLSVLVLSSFPAGANSLFERAETVGAEHGKSSLENTEAAITEADLRQYIERMTSEEFEGRGTGDPGERMATAYVASFFETLGLRPEGDEGSFFQNFEFNAGMEMDGDNALTFKDDESGGPEKTHQPGETYQPLSISTSGRIVADAVFAGFGLEHKDYSSFEGLEVKGKWLIVLRGSPEKRKDLKPFESLIAKTRLAKKKGAVGILFVKAANPRVGPEMIPPSTAMGPQILPSITLSDSLSASLLTPDGDKEALLQLLESYNTEEKITGYPLDLKVDSAIGLKVDKDPGRNVLGRLIVGDEPSDQVIVIGGHIDHLGFGNRGGSRAKGEASKKLHPGADDNASGIAAIMELAHHFSDQKASGGLQLDRDIVFAAWSGEELGLWGSRHHITEAREQTDKKVYPGVAAYVNLDMIGRAGEKGLIINGVGSSREWKAVLDEMPEIQGVEIKRNPSPHTPGDASPFYQAGVPVLAFFTGTHDDYHTPADTVDKINFPALLGISNYLKVLLEKISTLEEEPGYVEIRRESTGGPKAKVRLGIMMEEAGGKGIQITQVENKSPAARAGLLAKDVITELNGTAINDVAGLFKVLQKLEPDKAVPATVKRGDKEMDLEIVPAAR